MKKFDKHAFNPHVASWHPTQSARIHPDERLLKPSENGPAIKMRDKVFQGINHSDAYLKAIKSKWYRGLSDTEQYDHDQEMQTGFATTHRPFVNREVASKIADEREQRAPFLGKRHPPLPITSEEIKDD